jgi:RNA polymerase sigma factor (sigma-70 family)
VERWLEDLEEGRSEAAWDAFIERYRALVFAAIRHYLCDPDDVMDAFTWVCEGLRKDDFRRLRSYSKGSLHRARFTTWLVTVVRNLTVDWIRHRNGRARPSAASRSLPALQRIIAEEVFGEGSSHVEAYERIRSRDAPDLTFGEFLKELAAVHRLASPRELRSPEPAQPPGWVDPAAGRETREILTGALGSLPAEDRVAVEMYVLDELPAVDVARVLGLSNAKAVYNRVYRALLAVRHALERAGISREDL